MKAILYALAEINFLGSLSNPRNKTLKNTANRSPSLLHPNNVRNMPHGPKNNLSRHNHQNLQRRTLLDNHCRSTILLRKLLLQPSLRR